MLAWWLASLAEFLTPEPEAIVGALSTRLVETHPLNHATQVQAWRAQVDLLRLALAGAPGGWRLLVEYPLLRLGRRIASLAHVGCKSTKTRRSRIRSIPAVS